jgi:hypothetical protein
LLTESLSSFLCAVTSAGWEKSGFVSAMVGYSEGLSAEVFQLLENYLCMWAGGRWENKQKEGRK